MKLTETKAPFVDTGLHEAEAGADPFTLFERWLADAMAANPEELNAMTLATASPDGRPSARVVLLRGFDRRGFTFFTSYLGQKARELENNPRAALALHWPNLQRQVRVDGTVVRVAESESDAYFATRPHGSQISAWASPQSQVVADRAALETLHAEFERRFPGDVPRPPNWGGYRVVPDTIEFWQGRQDRLHDRLRYTRAGESWTRERLAP